MIPLTKTLQVSDYAQLATELGIVDEVGIEGQASEHRRWEYAMALRALRSWTSTGIEVGDIGGAGSGFAEMVRRLGYVVTVIDPSINYSIEAAPPAALHQFDALFAISVLEHVKEWRAFLRACVMRLAPGGLLFFTVDYWDAEGPDTAHFAPMRVRIYNRESLGDVLGYARDALGCCRFGAADWTYHGHTLYGSYTFASLALQKKEIVHDPPAVV